MLDFFLRSFSPNPVKWGPKLTGVLSRLGVESEEQCRVLAIELTTWRELQAGTAHDVPMPTILRALYVMAIMQLLHDLFGSQTFLRKWLRLNLARKPFENRTPLDLLTASDIRDMQALYLDLMTLGFGGGYG